MNGVHVLIAMVVLTIVLICIHVYGD